MLACDSAKCYVLVTAKGELYKITLEPAYNLQRLVEPGQGGYLAWGTEHMDMDMVMVTHTGEWGVHRPITPTSRHDEGRMTEHPITSVSSHSRRALL